jgi:hypothetical protein
MQIVKMVFLSGGKQEATLPLNVISRERCEGETSKYKSVTSPAELNVVESKD